MGLILLQFALAAQPVLGQEESGYNPGETKFFHLFPPPAEDGSKGNLD
jgi:hypothetical protein